MPVRRVILAALILGLLLGGVSAQSRKANDDSSTRSLDGVVTDGAAKPVTGAVVQLKDTKTLQIRSFYTQQDGTFHFAGLSTNVDYEVKADFNGSTSGTKTLSVFDNRKSATLNLKLK